MKSDPEVELRRLPGPPRIVTTALLAAVAAVLVFRAIVLARPPAPFDARNEQRFYEWAFGPRGLALHQALADKEDLFRDGEVVCFDAGVVRPGDRPRRDGVLASYLLPRQIVLVPPAREPGAPDSLPCRTRIVCPPEGTLRIERRASPPH